MLVQAAYGGRLLLAIPAHAQTGIQPLGRWQVDHGEYRCTLSRQFGEGSPVSLGIRMVPGDETADLILVNTAWTRRTELPDRVEIVFPPSGARLAAGARSGSVPGAQHKFMRVSAVDRSFFERLAAASALSIEGDGRQLLALELTEPDEAVRALRACHDDLMRSWGVDPAVLASLRRRPVPLGRTAAMMESSEPTQAQDTAWSFFVIIRYTVGTDGRVGPCDVVRSGGQRAAAQLLCSHVRRNARYEPAIGPDGRPVAVQLIHTTAVERRPG